MKQNRVIPYLGALKLNWCDQCNLPILDKKSCGFCKSKTRKVKLTPPGDIRPAFVDDIERISKIIDEKFGQGSSFLIGLNGERIVLLNEVSYDDLMDEIIIDGVVIGAIRYNLQLEDWDFVPRLKTAETIFTREKQHWKKYLIVDEGAVKYIEEGYNILAPGVVEIDTTLKKGETAVALSPQGKVLSSGNMRINASDLKNKKKGVVLKPKYSRKDEPIITKTNISAANQTWDQTVLANKYTIDLYEKNAIASIERVTDKYNDLPLSVSFSGGKDSLVCLLLASKLKGKDFKILFVNTGIEFPETVSYINSLIDSLNYRNRFCFMDIEKEKFWKSVEKFGPPGKDYRYCCKILKIGPINELIENCVGQKTLSLVGQRAYESLARSESKTLWTNPWIPYQLNFTPIQNWTALHVWLYIFKENVPFNPLYEKGFSRIGCWLCPACSQGTFEIVKSIKPDYWQEWNDFLEDWRAKNNLPKEWINWGLWRWKKLPKKLLDLAQELEIDLDYVRKEQSEPGCWDLQYTPIEGFATCKTGDLIIEGTFNVPINLPRLEQFWEIFCSTNYDDNLGILQGETTEGISVTISSDGAVSASGKELLKLEKMLKKLVLEVFRSEECTGCRICLSHCPTNAIFINEDLNQVEIQQNKCSQCGECHNRCPVIKFGHGEIKVVTKEE